MAKIVKKLAKAKVYNPKNDGRYSTYVVSGSKAIADGTSGNHANDRLRATQHADGKQ